MLFANRPGTEPAGLILSFVEAARQRAARRVRSRLARDAAARLLAACRQSSGNRR